MVFYRNKVLDLLEINTCIDGAVACYKRFGITINNTLIVRIYVRVNG